MSLLHGLKLPFAEDCKPYFYKKTFYFVSQNLNNERILHNGSSNWGSQAERVRTQVSVATAGCESVEGIRLRKKLQKTPMEDFEREHRNPEGNQSNKRKLSSEENSGKYKQYKHQFAK